MRENDEWMVEWTEEGTNDDEVRKCCGVVQCIDSVMWCRTARRVSRFGCDFLCLSLPSPFVTVFPSSPRRVKSV